MPFIANPSSLIYTIDPWIGLLIFLDILLIIIIVYAYSKWTAFQGMNKEPFKQESDNILNVVKEAKASLDAVRTEQEKRIKTVEELLTQMERVEARLKNIDDIERQVKEAKEMSNELDARAKMLEGLITHAEEIEKRLIAHRHEIDKYGEAVKLVNEGLSVEEVAKKLDIPRGEIELVIGLRQALKKV